MALGSSFVVTGFVILPKGGTMQSFRQCAFPVLLTSSNTLPSTTTAHTATASFSLRLPLETPWTADTTQQNVQAVLQEMVDSTAFFVDATSTTSDNKWDWRCSVPAFGDDCQIRIQVSADEGVPPTSLMLSFIGSTSESDFGWICTKLYEYRQQLGKHGVDCSTVLRHVVVQHYNQLPADPGLDAASAAWSPQQTADFERSILGENISTWLKRLETQGYVVIDHNEKWHTTTESSFSLATTAAQQNQLSEYYLHETTGQGDTIRTDRVHFLSRPEAVDCDIATHYDFLMGIANYLNERYHHHVQDQVFPTSPNMQPIPPATLERPLTIPRNVQFAEYGPGDFYTVSGRDRNRDTDLQE
jgi:hypothetical protein